MRRPSGCANLPKNHWRQGHSPQGANHHRNLHRQQPCLDPGGCRQLHLSASQSGDASYSAATTVTTTFAVTNPANIPPASVTSTVNGKTLYANCSGCHGGAAAGAMNVLAGANNPATLQAAISKNLGGMGRFSTLTGQNLADLAAYLATPTL